MWVWDSSAAFRLANGLLGIGVDCLAPDPKRRDVRRGGTGVVDVWGMRGVGRALYERRCALYEVESFWLEFGWEGICLL